MNEVNKNLTDKMLIDYSNRFTKMMLEGGLCIDRICLFVKDYQAKYIHIREQGGSEEQLKAFTPEMWFMMSKTDKGIAVMVK